MLSSKTFLSDRPSFYELRQLLVPWPGAEGHRTPCTPCIYANDRTGCEKVGQYIYCKIVIKFHWFYFAKYKLNDIFHSVFAYRHYLRAQMCFSLKGI